MKTTRRDLRRYPSPSTPSSKSPIPTKRKSPHPSDLSCSLHGLESLLDSEDHEFSFSREHPIDRIPPAEQGKQGTSSSSNSTSSTREVSDTTAKVEKALKSVNSQLSLLETKATSDSYACTMALKKAKDKLISLASLDKLLSEKRSAAEEQDRRLTAWQQELGTLQSQLEQRNRELNAREILIDEYVPRIQMLEQEVAEARKTIQTQKVTGETPGSKCEMRLDKSLPKLTEIESELKRTASLLESRTYELIREERELHRKEADLQLKQTAFIVEQEKYLAMKAELESNQQYVVAAKLHIQSQLEKLQKASFHKEAELCSSLIVENIISSASYCLQSRLLSSLENKKLQTDELISQLESELRHVRELQSILYQESKVSQRLQAQLRESEDRITRKEAVLNTELALIRESKIDQLLKRREESIAVKEKAFNEKLRKLKESQAEVRLKEESAQRMYDEAARKMAETSDVPHTHCGNCIKFESILRPTPESDLRNRELQLDLRTKALSDRERLLIDKESTLKDLQRSIETKQDKLKTLWTSLASAANLISRSKEQSVVVESPPQEVEEVREIEGVAGDGVEILDMMEVSDFTESFKVRQQQLIEHFADVERERREMSETLKEFLSSDNVAVKW